ncbi:MAG: hypothetical protein BGP06_09795 [Rhizobiales bacterium 65-9]|nr:ABC transporter substrate-binding protein [Hyphomicrobiales bacterium]OJY33193.1 MAG: hypothetical protein BGP06_09795 [Rhizobiales bacterium 65-9]
MKKFNGAGVLAVLVGAGWITVAAAQEGTIKIGAITPNTGGMAVLGNDLANWYELAADEINAKGGVLGKKVKIIRGDATNAQEAIAAVDKLATVDKVDIISGTIASFISQAASEAAVNYNKMYWETNALAVELTTRGLPNFLRTGPSAAYYAMQAADVSKGKVASVVGKPVNKLKIWVEHEDSNYGTSIATEVDRLMKAEGATVQIAGHKASAVDLTDSILRAQQANPDIFIISGYVVDTHLLLRTMRERNFKPAATILIGLGDSPDTLKAIGPEYLQGILIVTFPRQAINQKYAPGSDAVNKAYVDKYKVPSIGNAGINGYVGMQILFKAIEATKGDMSVSALMKAAKAMDMPIGSFTTGYGVKFDENMQNTRGQAVTYQWQGDSTKVVWPQEAALDGVSMIKLARP